MPPARLDPVGWPPEVIRAGCTVPALIALAVVAQRGLDRPTAAAAIVAALPWVVYGWARIAVSWWLTIGVTWVATVTLLLDPVLYDVAPLFLVFNTAVFSAVRPRVQSLAVLGGSVVCLVAVEASGHFDGSAIWVLAVLLGWLAGYSLLVQASAHEAATARVAAEERARMSLELHDVVAHSLAVTMLHLTGARLALARDPDEAAAALVQAEEAGRASMAQIRRVVGLAGPNPEAPAPGAPDLEALVAEYVAAGLAVDLDVDGDLGTVPPVAGLVLYRIAQESLANAARHAPGAQVEVRAEVDRNRVRLSVRDDGAGPGAVSAPGSGKGILGMHERASLAGGTVVVGPEGSGWGVAVDLPVGAGA